MFAAYSGKIDNEIDEAHKKEEKNWLKNTSFVPDISQQTDDVNRKLNCLPVLDVSLGSSISSGSTSTFKFTNLLPTSTENAVVNYQEATRKRENLEELTDRKRNKKKKKEKSSHHKTNTSKSKMKQNSTGVEQIQYGQVFYEDRNGDKNNLAFPHMYFKDVPRHFSARGSLGTNYMIKYAVKKQKPTRYFSKKAHKKLLKTLDWTSSTSLQPQTNEWNPLGIYDTGTLMYIKGQCGVEEESKLTVERKEGDIAHQTALFNEKLRENPHDTKLWLSFVDHQDLVRSHLYGNSSSNEEQMKVSHPKALLERKVSILDKAIEQNPKNVELLTARLKIASEYWDTSALHQEWRNILFNNPSLIELWKEYLNFVECRFEGFSVTTVLKVYSSCLQKLTQMLQPSFASHQRPAHLEEFMIDIMTHLCFFLRQCGWIEKSVSLNQAMMELCLKQPDRVSSSLTWLKELWESNFPRFGESSLSIDFKGLVSLRPVLRDISETEDTIVNSGKAFSDVWCHIECLRSREHWQASSTSDDCDDEERFVSFSDLSPYLFLIEERNDLQYRQVVGCLTSLGVPLLPAGQVHLFWAPLVPEENLLNCLSSVPKVASLSSSLPNVLNSSTYLAFLRRIVLQSFGLLKKPYKIELALWWLDVERIRIANIVQSSHQYEINRNWKETKGWIRSFLKDIPSTDSVSTVLLYNGYAAVEREIGSGEESQKTLKMVLQMYSSNPLIKLSQSGERAALIRTWFSYIRFLLRSDVQKSHQTALAYLVTLGAGSPFSADVASPTPAMLLKAKRKYEAILHDLSQPTLTNSTASTFCHPDEVVDLLGCYAYFLSLTDGCLAAFQMLQLWLNSSLRSDGGQHFTNENRFKVEFLSYHRRRESVYVTLLELLIGCRGWVKDVQPRLFHDTLCTALTEYPDSMHLLTIFIQSEERCNMFSRLWNSLIIRAKSLKNKTSCRTALAACLALASREETIKKGEESTFETYRSYSEGTPTLHLGYRRKLEHLVEHCVSRYPGCHVPVLWRILIRSAHLSDNSQRCKSLFYRAVRDCPTSKDIFLDVVEYIPTFLKEVISLMIEKDIRLRFPIEELRILLEEEKEEGSDKMVLSPPIIQEVENCS